MGGNNVFQYAPNPTGWIDPFGLSSWRKGTSKPSGWRLPKDGTWSGEVGHSSFIPNNPEKLGLSSGESISYRGGRPNLSPWSGNSKGLRVSGMTGSPKKDFTLMRAALANKMGWSVGATSEYLKANNIDLHHSSKNGAQFIPNSLHNGIRHTGPASALRNANNGCTKA